MNYYAHTAEDEEGKPLPESSGKWQLLSAHLSNVARLAKEFAIAFGLGVEAELAGLLRGSPYDPPTGTGTPVALPQDTAS
jgi:hypothetical protein